MVKVSAKIDLFPNLSPANPDCKLAGLGVHTLLLSLHSPLLKDIFKTLSDTSDLVVIVPDVLKSEIKSVLRVMYGIESVGFTSRCTLETLGLDSFKGFAVVEDLEEPVQEVIIDLEVPHVEMNNNGSLNNAISERIGCENNSPFEVPANLENEIEKEATELISCENNPPVDEPANFENEDENEIGKETTELTRFPCNICDKTFKSNKYRKCHIQAKHSSDPQFADRFREIYAKRSLARQRKCPLCEVLCNSKNLKTHIRTEHPTHSLVEICEICQKKFTTGSHLNRHFDECHSVSPVYTCSFCDYKTKDRGNLKKHVLVHSAEKPWKCEDCQFATKRLKELKTHKCNIKSFLCELCNKTSKTAVGLRAHKKRAHSA